MHVKWRKEYFDPMTIVLTLLVRDEADIIRQNIEYHLKNGVDSIILTDNGSVDGTLEICQEYLGSGIIQIIQEPARDFSQYAYVTRMANLASTKYNADWVINADADEFFLSENHQDLKSALSSIAPEYSMVSVNRNDFVPIHRDYKDFSPTQFPYQKKKSLNLRGESLPPKVVHRGGSSDIQVSQGNHSVTGSGLDNILVDSPIQIFHYPIRSINQFRSKVRNAGSGYANNTKLNKTNGFHKRYWYDLLLKGELEKEFKKHFYTPEKLSNAIASGDLVEDLSLTSYTPFDKKVAN